MSKPLEPFYNPETITDNSFLTSLALVELAIAFCVLAVIYLFKITEGNKAEPFDKNYTVARILVGVVGFFGTILSVVIFYESFQQKSNYGWEQGEMFWIMVEAVLLFLTFPSLVYGAYVEKSVPIQLAAWLTKISLWMLIASLLLQIACIIIAIVDTSANLFDVFATMMMVTLFPVTIFFTIVVSALTVLISKLGAAIELKEGTAPSETTPIAKESV